MRRTIIFQGTVDASSEKTLVSDRIDAPFVLEEVLIYCAPGHDCLVDHKIFVSPDDNAPTSGMPTGVNVFSGLGQADKVIGDDTTIVLKYGIRFSEMGNHIKLYANNNEALEHTLMAAVIIDIELNDEKEAK